MLPRPIRAAALSLTTLLAALPALAAELVVTVAHTLDQARPAETISVPWSEVNRALPGAFLQKIVVRDAAGRVLPYQVTNIAPLAKDPDRVGATYGELLFQHDFAAGEKSAAFTIAVSDTVSPPFPVKAFARQVPERLDDFAWENDRVAHRTYGLALAAQPAPGGTKEILVTSGLDVWCKRVAYPIVDRWYNKGHDHYHFDQGEGMDMYGVGPSRGCGGLGVWSDGRLYVSGNYARARVLASGPVRASFELSYDTWAADGVYVSEIKRITLDAGRQLNLVESTFTATGKTPVLSIGVGLHKNPADKGQEPEVAFSADPAAATLVQWVSQKTNGALGTAVVIADPSEFTGFAEDARNQLMLARAEPGRALRYLVGAAWDRAGHIPDQAAWRAHVAAEAARLRSPVVVTLATR